MTCVRTDDHDSPYECKDKYDMSDLTDRPDYHGRLNPINPADYEKLKKLAELWKAQQDSKRAEWERDHLPDVGYCPGPQAPRCPHCGLKLRPGQSGCGGGYYR